MRIICVILCLIISSTAYTGSILTTAYAESILWSSKHVITNLAKDEEWLLSATTEDGEDIDDVEATASDIEDSEADSEADPEADPEADSVAFIDATLVMEGTEAVPLEITMDSKESNGKMKAILLGAAGFIGTNLILKFARDINNEITAVDRDIGFFDPLKTRQLPNLGFVESELSVDTDYERLVEGQDIVYHLISTTVPTTSNQHITEELKANVVLSANLFEACVRQNVKKVVFISSGGTVYGKESKCPLNEKTPTNPITSYGVQKITIEKLLYLYNYMYGLDYRIIRLSNPYGPYQRPNGVLGAVTTFTYKALKGEEINVYGDGSVIRDFIYIDDAVRGIQKIVNGNDRHHTFNLGCGYGTSIKQVLEAVKRALDIKVYVRYTDARKVDVPVNYLDINRFETAYGSLNPISLEEGIKKTAEFMKEYYGI